LLPLVADLSREIDDRERYRRLLHTLRALFLATRPPAAPGR
jgi:anaerobic nitric oxide reductase transcription regulator